MKVKHTGKTIVTIILLAAVMVSGFFLIRAWKDKLDRQRVELQHQQELEAVEELSGPMDAEEISELEEYPNLKELDLTGSSDYPAIMEYILEHPDVDVSYTVDLGGTVLDNHIQDTTLKDGTFSMDLLQERLQYLPALQKLHLVLLTTSPEAVDALRNAYPDREITCMVQIGEQMFAPDTAVLDFTGLSPEDVDSAAAALPFFTNLETIRLTDSEGNNTLTPEELCILEAARPDVSFDYRMDLFGQTVSFDDARIEFINVPIGNDGVDTLRAALPCLKNCKSLLLDGCGIDNEVLGQLREEFPDLRIDWRVSIGHLSFLTDVKIIHLTFLLDQRDANQRAKVLQYCTDVEYLDLGHQHLTDIGFTAYMPNLKYLILSYNDLSDISPLANCKNLEMAEFYFCYALEDISPLANCEKLKLLNVSATKVHDISPVFGLKELERFYCIMNFGIPDEQMTQIYEELPDCWITFKQVDSYEYKNVGWSFDQVGGIRAQWYLDMYKILRYRVEGYFFGDYPEEFKEQQASEQAEDTSDAPTEADGQTNN